MQTATPDENDGQRNFLTDLQLAARWGISPKTLRNARVSGGHVPFVRIGRLVRYRIVDVQAFEAAHLRRSTTDQQGQN